MNIQTIAWLNNSISIIDQTKLPLVFKRIYIKDIKSLWKAIKLLKVRGAPALGAAAGLGVYLGVRNSKADDFRKFKGDLERVISCLGSSRPTAKNLFWGLERMRACALKNKHKPVQDIKQLLLKEAQRIINEDKVSCRRIGFYGSKLIKDNDTILTICNAGMLATIDYGTALGVIYRAVEEGKHIKVFALETRPLLQGARLTCWELKQKGVDVTLICDNMIASLMQEGKIDKVITGADRIASNGDTANKIGTYNLALLSRYHKVPFYVASPASTFDPDIKSGSDIPIEERSPKEVTELFFKRPLASRRLKVYNPAFDVTPHRFISGIITDRGIIKRPYKQNIKKIIGR